MHFSISQEFKIHSQFYIRQLSLLNSLRLTSSIQLQHATNNVFVGWDERLQFEGKFCRMVSKQRLAAKRKSSEHCTACLHA
jgi:hypothetical protein